MANAVDGIVHGAEGEAGIIECRSGVVQGSALSPLLFSLVIHPALLKLQEKFPELAVLAYLDDICIIGDVDELEAANQFLAEELKKLSLEI